MGGVRQCPDRSGCRDVIGYSLPEADSQARALISLGFQWNRTARWLVIDESAYTCARYEHLIGTRQLVSLPIKLEDLNPALKPTLDALLPAG